MLSHTIKFARHRLNWLKFSHILVLQRLYSVVVITPDFDAIEIFRQPRFEPGYDLIDKIFVFL